MESRTSGVVDGTTNYSCEKLNCLRHEMTRYIKEKYVFMRIEIVSIYAVLSHTSRSWNDCLAQRYSICGISQVNPPPNINWKK